MSHLTPAQLYSLLLGGVLLAVGVLGFAVDSSFSHEGSHAEGSNLILFEVNGWHNVVHIASGLLGLAVARSLSGSRMFALGFGAVYAVVTIWGFADGDAVLFGLVAVNGWANLLHLAIAAAGIGAGLASPGTAPGRAAPSAA
jgi:Domain of unknown function (DUF4383)